MRVLILTLAIVCGLVAVPATVASSVPFISAVAVLDAQASAPTVDAQAQQSQAPQINVEINRGGRAWYASPVWIAIGGIALVLVILLIVMAARGGGTTVVKG